MKYSLSERKKLMKSGARGKKYQFVVLPCKKGGLPLKSNYVTALSLKVYNKLYEKHCPTDLIRALNSGIRY
jgi:hypothetical protein